MADVVKSTGTLQIVAEFTDGDDRTLTLDNPAATVTAAAINAASDYAKTHELIIGNDNATLVGFISAKKKTTTETTLDLS